METHLKFVKYFAFGIALMLLSFVTSLRASSVSSGDPKLDQTIERANSEWAEAMKAGDSATIAAPYADDAVFVGFDGSCTRGRAEIEKMYDARFKRSGFAVSTKIESRNLTIDGDLAYESGYGEVGMKKDGKTVTNGGRFLTVWQQKAGEWKITHNIVLP
jgi:uncharacterized protein (TIGR02246 family)